jgi:hypothetical protein
MVAEVLRERRLLRHALAEGEVAMVAEVLREIGRAAAALAGLGAWGALLTLLAG